MRLRLIAPITDPTFERDSDQEAKRFASPGTEIEARRIAFGPASIECAYDDALAVPGIVKQGLECARQGYDGILISCMADPGVDALRELVDIPVVGPCRTALLYAADVAHHFSVITVTDGVVPLIEKIALEVGVAGKMESCRAVNIPVLELVELERLTDTLLKLAVTAVKEDGAQALILGCTGMIGVDQRIHDLLLERGYDVPVLYPVPIAVRHLESLVSLQLSHSRSSYPAAPEKERNIWDLLER